MRTGETGLDPCGDLNIDDDVLPVGDGRGEISLLNENGDGFKGCDCCS